MITINKMDGYNDAVTDINQKILKSYQTELSNVETVHMKGMVIASKITRLFGILNETNDILVEVRSS